MKNFYNVVNAAQMDLDLGDDEYYSGEVHEHKRENKPCPRLRNYELESI